MYRYQKPEGKFIFRAGWTPLYYIEDARYSDPIIIIAFLLFPGASIGYAF